MMQPHIPFRSRPEWFGRRESLDIFGEAEREDGKDPWKRVRDGEIDREAFWDAYLDNLHWALEHVDRLRRGVDATLLITSDHGNGMGEQGCWSHPPGQDVPALRRVPWVKVSGRGESFVAWGGEPKSADATVEEQLEALGYA